MDFLQDEDFASMTVPSLIMRMSSDVEHQHELLAKQTEIDKLRENVLQLLRRKAELQSLRDVQSSTCSSSSQQLVREAAKIEAKKCLKYIISAQRCYGISAEVATQGRIKIRYETSYKGHVYKPYYLELKCNDKLEISWHTMPAFVPLNKTIKKYNDSEVKFLEMLHIIHNHLLAYVKRRQQIFEFHDLHDQYLEDDIAATPAHDIIQLRLKIPVDGQDLQVIVQLYYNNIQTMLPSSVRCTVAANFPVDKSSIKEAFMTQPLSEAFQNLFLVKNK